MHSTGNAVSDDQGESLPLEIIILANQAGDALKPLTDKRPLPLLPICGKSLLEHSIESTECLQPIHIYIAASRELVSVKNFVEDGTRWGVPISVLPTKHKDEVHHVLARHRAAADTDLLIIPADRLINAPLSDVLEALRAVAYGKLAQTVDEQTGMIWIPADARGASGQAPKEQNLVSLPHFGVHSANSLKGYHAMNGAVARGELSTCTTRGKERALGLTTGYQTQVPLKSLRYGTVVAGNRCRIHSSCELNGTVVINHDVAIDRHTEVHDSVILDNTYIGDSLTIKNAIVDGGCLIRVDTGAVLQLTDRFMMAELNSSIYQEHFAGPVNRLAGLALCVLSLPLWVPALLLSPADAKGTFGHRLEYLGNKPGFDGEEKRSFKSFRFNTPHGMLRYLPLVIPLALGHIRLVGVSAMSTEELAAHTEGWELARNAMPVGLLGPTQLHVGMDAPVEQRLLSDAVFSQRGSSLSRSLRVLFSALSKPLRNPDQEYDALWAQEG